jgi:hypothetical protein
MPKIFKLGITADGGDFSSKKWKRGYVGACGDWFKSMLRYFHI